MPVPPLAARRLDRVEHSNRRRRHLLLAPRRGVSTTAIA